MDNASSQLDLLERLGLVTQAGSWYSLDGDNAKFQRRQWPSILAERTDLQEIIREAPLLWRPDPNEKAEELVDV